MSRLFRMCQYDKRACESRMDFMTPGYRIKSILKAFAGSLTYTLDIKLFRVHICRECANRSSHTHDDCMAMQVKFAFNHASKLLTFRLHRRFFTVCANRRHRILDSRQSVCSNKIVGTIKIQLVINCFLRASSKILIKTCTEIKIE